MAETTIEGLAQTLTSDHLLGPVHSCPTRSPTILVSPKPRISRTRSPLSLQYPPKPTSSLSPPRPLLGFSTPFSPSSRSTSTVLLATPESQLSLGDSPETREWDMQDFYLLRKDVETTSKRVEEVRASSGLEQLEEEVRRLETAAADDSFWDDRSRAQQILMALNDVKDKIKLLTEIKTQVEDAETIVNLTEEMDSIDGALLQEAVSLVKELNKVLDRFELTQLLSGPYDKEGAVLYITAGAGGTDAQLDSVIRANLVDLYALCPVQQSHALHSYLQDWADMLLRMYVRWGEKQRYKTKVVEMSSGEEAGIKSATVEIEGRYAYGYLSGEKGTHRIVRQSPFNAKGLRQTSFSGVEIMPLLPDESMAVEIPEEDLDISFSRAGGKGGQNVNKVETAVRITHIPTGVTVRCTVAIIYTCSYGLFPAENCGGDQLFVEVYQTRELVEGRTFNIRDVKSSGTKRQGQIWMLWYNLLEVFLSVHNIILLKERTQLANKTKALSRLKAKLLVIAEEQRAKEIKQIRGDAVKAEWGQQIRNYIFHPYKLVKDVRTGLETSDVVSVLDGELDPFIKAYLKYKYSMAMATAVGIK
ncbi:hypothetical protein RHGRI_027173 [Rhododendron griersonianum]|uniref:Prokaryotic-type class I peptide chain release factors domain-containing protein n=1 Tax=Rhododendron griersonianum TaxID=479676 RepID=A0AAV6IVC7_9ERIC|nr:hypothetical protein RHGRI_027173 [Rhododendron griersonianum]